MAVRKLKTFLDMDGVICNILLPWLSEYNHQTGENIQVEDIKEWDLFKQVKQPKVLNKILLSKKFFQKPEPYLDMLKVLPRLLKDERFDIYILTQVPRSSPYAGWDKREWLRKYLPQFDMERFISAHHKYLLSGRDRIILDDHPRHLKQWFEEGGTTVCFDHPYNREATCTYRIGNWGAFEQILEEIWWSSPPKSCNIHDDCSKANRKEGDECCWDEDCPDCFGR